MFGVSRFDFCSGSFLCKMLSLAYGPQHADFVQDMGRGTSGMQSRWRNSHTTRSNHTKSYNSLIYSAFRTFPSLFPVQNGHVEVQKPEAAFCRGSFRYYKCKPGCPKMLKIWWFDVIWCDTKEWCACCAIYSAVRKTRWKPRTRKLTRLFRPYFGRNTPRGSVGVTFLVRHAWNDSIGKSLLVRKSWSDTLCKTSLRRSWSNTLGKTLLVRDSWSHTLCNTLLECYSL